MRKWAIEGLSYLTLDAEVKEKLIEDKEALQSLIEVAKVDSESIMIAGNFLTAKPRPFSVGRFFSYLWSRLDFGESLQCVRQTRNHPRDARISKIRQTACSGTTRIGRSRFRS